MMLLGLALRNDVGNNVGQAMCNPLGLWGVALAFREGRAEQGILAKLQLLMDVLALA